ncbi:MAG TPA: MarR family transcriptional regulator [Kribbella sp.]|jgi:DNA-binding MarR family transcriptional regulator
MKDTTTDSATGQVAEPASGIELGTHIKRAEHAIMARKAEALRSLDLTVPQCMALGFLMGGASKTCTHLAREAGVTSQTMTGIVQNLETKGLVARRTSPDHGRVVLVSLTDDGASLAGRAHAVATEVERSIGSEFTDEERTHLARLLDRATAAAPRAGSH